MARHRAPVTLTELGRYECQHCSQRFAWLSPRPFEQPLPGEIGGRRGGGRPPAYCSKYCSGASRRKREKDRCTKPCLICGKNLNTRHRETQTCSSECALNLKRGMGPHTDLPLEHWARHYGATCEWKAPKTRNPSFVAGTCVYCRNVFVDRWLGDSSSKYCSKKCALREGANRRKIAKRGAKLLHAGINWKSVAKRDGMGCHICGDACDPKDFSRVGPHFKPGITFPTVDHVIPLSTGGTHTWNNVKLAHHLCNSYKGAKVETITQLA